MNNVDKRQQQKKSLCKQLKKTPIIQIACEKIGISRYFLFRSSTKNEFYILGENNYNKNMKKELKKLRVVDFFCGAGGFSEGFRQQEFQIIKGIDFWEPAIDSHNLNHNLNDTTKDVLDFWNENSSNIEEIKKIPDSEFIIGSPSCVSFSMSNKSGKGDKTLGILLIEAYLRVIAVKKHQKKSVLLAWYMENVPKSKDHIKSEYTFANLNLGKWAKSIGKKPNDIALKTDGGIFNAGDYGAPQQRKRFIAGEWVESGEFLAPQKTHEIHVKSCDIRKKMPNIDENENKIWTDPNYSNLKLKTDELTDHFYDTGLYEIEWEKAEHLKTNHPFMGMMSFPENEERTCRTITATRSAITREALIYKSEYNRKGNGEYRLPTIREIACLMGYPYAYQFVGSEGVKWRQVGNSVCPHMSFALAKALRKKMNLQEIKIKNVDFSSLKKNFTKINNLNTFEEKTFNQPKKRKTDARFRRHPIKMGNMTVDLMNYHPEKKDEVAQNWYLSTFFGTGNDHGVKVLETSDFQKIENILQKYFSEFSSFKKEVKNRIATKKQLQKIYEEDLLIQKRDNPLKIVKRLAKIIRKYDSHTETINIDNFFPRNDIPVAQLMAMYGLLKLIQSNSLTQKI